ncbi:hypothetical protein [Nocardioides pantholopis]|uniref:hypothetical protein n=1 Tax=Nocardioides pantholopis TaxID=2483798 RepID=UPI000FD937CB|nr:hypothetical protein [Nocardioides pantholopis]
MNETAPRRMGAIAGAAITIVITTVAGPVASAPAAERDTTDSRPCFMVRGNWNLADGPQPTCPIPTRQQAAGSDRSDAPPDPSHAPQTSCRDRRS